MPDFKSNRGFKMKGSEFFGHGNASPLKVSDETVIAAQNKLDHIETDFREPGWAKAARSINEGVKGVLGKSAKVAEAGGGETSNLKGGEKEAAKGGVEAIAAENIKIDE